MMVVVYKELKGVMQTLKSHERSTSRPAKSSARNCAFHGQVGLSFKAVKVFTISNKAMVIQSRAVRDDGMEGCSKLLYISSLSELVWTSSSWLPR